MNIKSKYIKSKSILALAIAGAFACGSAIAEPGHPHSSSVEVSTPMSVNESAPWLANQQHSAGWASAPDTHMALGVQEGQWTDGPVGTSSNASGYGSVGFDSSASSMSSSAGYDATAMSDEAPVYLVTEYWLLGADNESTAGTGASSSASGYGEAGFSSGPIDTTYDYYLSEPLSYYSDSGYEVSSSSFLDEPLAVIYTPSAEDVLASIGDSPLVTEHYLVSKLDSDFAIVLEAGPAPEDIAMMESLKNDFFVLTPATDDV